MPERNAIRALALGALTLLLPVVGEAQMSSTGFEMSGRTIEAGGSSASTSHQLTGAVLSAGSGLSSSTGYRLTGGPVLSQVASGGQPELVAGPAGTGTAGSSATITVDFLGASSATLWYLRPGLDEIYTPLVMSAIAGAPSGQRYSATLPAAAVTAAGVRYYFTADGAFPFGDGIYPAGAPTGTAVYSLEIAVEDFRLATTSGGVYAMLSVPIIPEDSSPEEAFDELGPYDPEQWRFGTYDAASETVREYPNSNPLTNGRGFWIVTRDSEAIEISGMARATRFNETYGIPGGWSQIGTPWGFAYEVDDLGFDDDFEQNLVAWTGTGYRQNVDTMVPGQAYWIFSRADVVQPLTFFVNPADLPRDGEGRVPATGGPRRVPADVEGWCVRVDATTETRDDLDHRFGMRADATDGRDRLDFTDAPTPPSGYVRARLIEQGDTPRSLFTDYRALGGDGARWEIALDTDQPGATWELRFEVERALPVGWQLLAVAPDGTRHDLTGGGTLSGTVPGTRLERTWTILAGTPAWIEGAPAAAGPAVFAVDVAAANPLRVGGRAALELAVPDAGKLDLSVVDAQGRRVRDLHRGAIDPGRHRFAWDGRDDAGRDLAAGVYFIDARLGDRARSAKLVLVR